MKIKTWRRISSYGFIIVGILESIDFTFKSLIIWILIATIIVQSEHLILLSE